MQEAGQPSTRRRARVALVLSAALTAAIVVAACGSQDEPKASSTGNGPVPITTIVSSGEQIYAKSCARCHGAQRQGKGDAPKLDSVRMASLGDQVLRLTIVNGKGRMRGFGGLSDADVVALMKFLRTV